MEEYWSIEICLDLEDIYIWNKMSVCNNGDLVLVEVAMLEFLLTLILEGDDDKTYEEVHHEEGDHHNVGDVKQCDCWFMHE